MNKYGIIFVYDSDDDIQKKMDYIIKKVGEENVSLNDLLNRDENGNYLSRWITIRCNKEVWEDIRFHLDLSAVYA